MTEEYKKKFEGLGFDLQKMQPKNIWTTEDGRYVTPVIFDKTIFNEIGELGTVAGVVEVMNKRITEKYGLLSEEFEVFNYYGDGLMNRLVATVFINRDAVSRVLKENDFYCN